MTLTLLALVGTLCGSLQEGSLVEQGTATIAPISTSIMQTETLGRLLILWPLLDTLVRVSGADAPASNANRSDGVEAPLGQSFVVHQPPDTLIRRGHRGVHGHEPQSHMPGHGEFQVFMGGTVDPWPSVDQGHVHLSVLQRKRLAELRGTDDLRVTLQVETSSSVSRQIEPLLAVLGGGGKVLPRGVELSVQGAFQYPGSRSGGIGALDDQVEDLVDLEWKRGSCGQLIDCAPQRDRWSSGDHEGD
jgi:hypothetical protein